MGEEMEKEPTLADALDRCDSLFGLVEEFGPTVPGDTVGVIRKVLRRQGMLLERAADLLDEMVRTPWLAEYIPAAAVALRNAMLGLVSAAPADPVPDKPVPHPSDKTPVPDDHQETIRAVNEGRG